MVLPEESRKADYDSLEIQYLKGVKYLFENGIEHVPKKYILPASDRPNFVNERSHGADNFNLELPIIDFAELQGPNRSEVLNSLASACENYGFFQLLNHGIPYEITSNMVDVSKRFFELPFSEREKYMSADMGSPVRYGTSYNQTNDDVFCWRDFLKLVCHPLPDALPHWPSSPLDFRKLAVSYAKEVKFLFLMLVDAILESLGLMNKKNKTEENDEDEDKNKEEDEDEDEEILKEFEDGSQLMVLNCYPPCPQPDLTLGMPPHSDYGFLTLLLQDEVKGLQIQHKENWVTVKPIPGSFVVNVGDHLEIFSNGRFKSVLHKVLVNPMDYRISVASLHCLPFKSIVQPCPKLVSETNPRHYMDTNFASFIEYLKSRDSTKENFLHSRKLTS
ncbi:protein DMR6-LIKE OXYGENASE 1-like isoform X1 [Olea europaea var. sylvestris]|uniref:protein DMR6-LIKE OXYGENASE 1-like isoform X1 n=1 Tax=Olea europaea var. sylvestris TaxID=158386 RepID=UPI000C1D8A53|nr:protein DMR6-LIKE OXYGENASE 1-like isoform X1 [Olea europaea var. sylvestris]